MLSPRSTGATRARLLSSSSSSSASGGLAPRFAGGGFVGYQNPGGYEDPGVVREGKKNLATVFEEGDHEDRAEGLQLDGGPPQPFGRDWSPTDVQNSNLGNGSTPGGTARDRCRVPPDVGLRAWRRYLRHFLQKTSVEVHVPNLGSVKHLVLRFQPGDEYRQKMHYQRRDQDH